MFACVSQLLAAVRSLTEEIWSLAATIRQTHEGIRNALDGHEDSPAVLDHKPEPLPRRNGRVKAE